jgi:site-specific DNA-methyltransferase (adenine-specific)
VVLTPSKERDRHPWQRPLEEFHHFTKYLTRPGEWVLDPMAGSFVSGRAAVLLGRNYVGVDIDRKAVIKGRAWLEEE